MLKCDNENNLIVNNIITESNKKPIYIDTVDDLANIPAEDRIFPCIVKDKDRGGIFVYDENAGDDDGGIVFSKWVRQYSGHVNVRWFGAKGDSVDGINGTDDTAAFNAAFKFDEVFIPDGWYLVTRTYIDNPTKLLFSKNSILSSIDTDITTSSNTMISIRSDNVSIDGLHFFSPGEYPYYAVRALEKELHVGHKNISIINSKFENGKNCLKFDNTEDVLVDNVEAVGAHNGWALASRQGKRQLWNNCRVYDCVTDDTSIGGADGIKISSDPYTVCEDITIQNCIMHNNSRDGIDVNVCNINGLRVVNNNIKHCVLTGVEIKSGVESEIGASTYQNVEIIGNTIEMANTDRACINIQNTYQEYEYKNCIISNNIFIHTSADSSITQGSVKIQSADNITISNNRFINQQYGVILVEGASNIDIINNTMTGRYGVSFHSGENTQISIHSNSFDCYDGTIIRAVSANGINSIHDNTFMQPSDSDSYAVYINDSIYGGLKISVDENRFIGGRGVSVLASNGSSSDINSNTFDDMSVCINATLDNESVVNSHNNDFTKISYSSTTTIVTVSSGEFYSSRNIRGYYIGTDNPDIYAATGDVVYNPDPSDGDPVMWIMRPSGWLKVLPG